MECLGNRQSTRFLLVLQRSGYGRKAIATVDLEQHAVRSELPGKGRLVKEMTALNSSNDLDTIKPEEPTSGR